MIYHIITCLAPITVNCKTTMHYHPNGQKNKIKSLLPQAHFEEQALHLVLIYPGSHGCPFFSRGLFLFMQAHYSAQAQIMLIDDLHRM